MWVQGLSGRRVTQRKSRIHQVLESSLADGIISGVARLSCEIGVPKKLFIDQDRASICGMEQVEFDMRGLQHQLERQYGSTSRCAP
jgi:hypothetical protein